MNQQLQFDEHDLKWSAICYLNGEFDERSNLQFEAFLAVNRDAERALHEAVELMQYAVAVKLKEPVLTPTATDRQSNSKLLIVLALAGCLFLMASLAIWFVNSNSTDVVVQATDQSLALSWSFVVEDPLTLDDDGFDSWEIPEVLSDEDVVDEDSDDWLSVAASSIYNESKLDN